MLPTPAVRAPLSPGNAVTRICRSWGISHQQFPVVDVLLFSCDLFFSHSVSQGKNKQARDNYHSPGMSSGDLGNVFSSGTRRSGPELWARQLVITHLFSGFPRVPEAIAVAVRHVVWRKFQPRWSLYQNRKRGLLTRDH